MSDGLIELLREDARAYSRGTKMVAAAKGPNYSGLEPEQTTAWRAANEIERLRAELEVSEAVNRAKTELLVDLKALLTQDGMTPAQRARNALVEIQVRTGPPKSIVPQQLASDK